MGRVDAGGGWGLCVCARVHEAALARHQRGVPPTDITLFLYKLS